MSKASQSVEAFERTFSKNLRVSRNKSGYTQKQVAKATGIPIATIIKLEEGKFEGKWRFALFMKICAFYGYKPHEMAANDFVFEHKSPL
jgi:DNA-binding XRE family transcriptional regulator